MEEREVTPLSIAWDYREYLRALEKKDTMEEAFRQDPTQLEIKETIKTKDRVDFGKWKSNHSYGSICPELIASQ